MQAVRLHGAKDDAACRKFGCNFLYTACTLNTNVTRRGVTHVDYTQRSLWRCLIDTQISHTSLISSPPRYAVHRVPPKWAAYPWVMPPPALSSTLRPSLRKIVGTRFPPKREAAPWTGRVG